MSDTHEGDPPETDPPKPDPQTVEPAKAADPEAPAPEAAPVAEPLAAAAPPPPAAAPASPPDRSFWVGIAITAVAVIALFFLMTGKHEARTTTVAASGPKWIGDVQSGLGERGYDWVRIDVRDGVATVSGVAPDVDSRQYGFEAAQTALQRADAGDVVQVVVDATDLAGGTPGVGAAMKALGPTPAAADCQVAFQSTLANRPVAFTPDSADLTDDNMRLLDTLSAVALRCKAYRMEIGAHTEAAGAGPRNVRLSQQRAAAVESYLVGKGVPQTALTTRGYGASKPLDPARGPAADARNRRIEFTVAGS